MLVVIATLGTAPVAVFEVAARRPAAGPNSWIGQTHERGQRRRRQGRPRGGLSIEGKAENGPSVDASKLILLACSMWPVRILAESDAGKTKPRGRAVNQALTEG